MKAIGNANKSKKKTSSKPKPTKKHLFCTFQTDQTYIKAPEPDLCIFCGFKANVTVPNLKGKLAQHDCLASICLPCLQRCLENQYKLDIMDLFCPICLHVFTLEERARVHPDLNNQISDQLLNVDFVKCKFCPNRYIFEPATKPEMTSYNGRDLTEDQIKCMLKNAVTCNECHISSCYQCGAVPYHLGETCEEHKLWVEGSVCRICGRAAKPDGETALRTCGHPDCKSISDQMCNHVHACGHACLGIKGEKQHPPCPECSDTGSICPFCEKDLWGSLCLLLDCGHTIHLDCALKIIKRPRQGPELRLPLCPYIGCGSFIKHELLQKEAKEDYEEWLRLEPQIDRIAKQRIIAEGIDFHPEVVSKSSPFAQNCEGEAAALNWAKKKLRFMICRNHLIPLIYTNGRLEDPPLLKYSCPECLHYPYPKCPTHGFNYMQYKCEYCCSTGVRRDKEKNGDGLVWLCEICHDMPGRRSTKEQCKGNCQFYPHPRPKLEFYGRCQKCGILKSMARPKGGWTK
ncbi:regulation of axon guidance [Tritrichomonas musculus]|uniref:Regulation of axon guidance n=1 Tax=Tritrichomonas musculus TaxID=1915356 RepID=A0ABR2JXW6_9EUKA